MSFLEGLDIVGTLAGSLDGLKAMVKERRKEEEGKENRGGGKHPVNRPFSWSPSRAPVPVNGIAKFVPICSP